MPFWGSLGTILKGFLGHLIPSLNTKSLLREGIKCPKKPIYMGFWGTSKKAFSDPKNVIFPTLGSQPKSLWGANFTHTHPWNYILRVRGVWKSFNVTSSECMLLTKSSEPLILGEGGHPDFLRVVPTFAPLFSRMPRFFPIRSVFFQFVPFCFQSKSEQIKETPFCRPFCKTCSEMCLHTRCLSCIINLCPSISPEPTSQIISIVCLFHFGGASCESSEGVILIRETPFCRSLHEGKKKEHINFEHINFLKVGTPLGQPAG